MPEVVIDEETFAKNAAAIDAAINVALPEEDGEDL